MAPKTRPAIDRFREKTRLLDNGCIEWLAYRGANGYGRFYVNGRGALAHRWSYEHFVWKIPDGLQIDHLCRNRGCVNPDHLEPVVPSENVRRGIAAEVSRARAERQTHCLRGHEFTPENTTYGKRGRTCRSCKRELGRRHYQENREEYIARASAWRAEHPERFRESARLSSRRYRIAQKEK